jgi:hypothetical protein
MGAPPAGSMEGVAVHTAAAVLASAGAGAAGSRLSSSSGASSAAGSAPGSPRDDRAGGRRRNRPVLAYEAPIYKSDEFRIKCEGGSGAGMGGPGLHTL